MAPHAYETSNHSCQLYALCFEAVIYRLLHVTNFAGDLELRPQFRHRTFSHVEKPDGLSIRTALVSLSQIARDADGTASHLIPKTEILLQILTIRHMVNFHGQIFCLLPYNEILKTLFAIASCLIPPWRRRRES